MTNQLEQYQWLVNHVAGRKDLEFDRIDAGEGCLPEYGLSKFDVDEDDNLTLFISAEPTQGYGIVLTFYKDGSYSLYDCGG